MRDAVKIVTIGGGSSYTPELVEGFIIRYDKIPIAEHWFVDVEEGREKVEIVAAMAQRMWDASGHDVKVHVSFDLREALPHADYVTTQFRVGLLDARIKDERIPLSYGILGQETNGAGGIFKALRTIPVIRGILENMRELCPDAWLVNFTNPSVWSPRRRSATLDGRRRLACAMSPSTSRSWRGLASGWNGTSLSTSAPG